MRTHKHHIVPKHIGGTDEPSNLVELTIEQHADAHRILYETHGRWQDRVAWLSLAGIMNDEERIYEILKNSNPGGYKHTTEAKQKLSQIMSGENNPMYGKPAPNRGVKRPGIGGRKKGTKWSETERQKQMKIRSQQGYYDYLLNPLRGEKISKSLKGRSGSATGKTWFNNGQKEIYDFVCPDGFAKGRLKRTQPNKRGLKWYTDGNINRQFKDGEQPQGFVSGRICKK